MDMTQTDRTALLERIRSAKRVVIFSGAGLSAESGIPTFRDANNSLWANVDPMAVASIKAFKENPERVWAWHEEMRKMFSNSKPNPGHEAMSGLEMLLQPAKVQVITQNIDGFHQDAGNSWVLEIHGTTRDIRCHRNCGFIEHWSDISPRKCPVCGAPTRPSVVWFGESLDEARFDLATEAAEMADVFFVVGTSGMVQPAASLPIRAKNNGAMVVEVNPSTTPLSSKVNLKVRASASDFFPKLCKDISAMRLRQVR
jgi:NAD-dependent deacetylase